MVGDVVYDKNRRFGTVTHIVHYDAGPAELVIEKIKLMLSYPMSIGSPATTSLSAAAFRMKRRRKSIEAAGSRRSRIYTLFPNRTMMA
jgi:hypothetical protein